MPRARVLGPIVVGLAAVIAVAGCTANPPPAWTFAPPAPRPPGIAAIETVAPDPTASPTAVPAPASASSTAGALTFESKHYPYAMTLPAGVAFSNWRSASKTWDGLARVDIAGLYVDRVSIPDGTLLFFGGTANGLDEFFRRFEANGTRYHGCTQALNRRTESINGVAAISFTQRCVTDATFARVALFKDGYGIAAYVLTLPGREIDTRDRLIELLDGLEWRTG
jgi:hypothetical protein